ncbi:MAG TPA: 50S ribosomal protein L18 [Ignavibacteria bacterium]|nr:50S ribosomal protein L18 [Ignavibacteria bacterium]HQY52919.1 50S ribosomal protein L18 [Ignavibacteria bacterium]HRB00333.1 50S ribosomal protein L18 [Ignavibacteria bacterium]
MNQIEKSRKRKERIRFQIRKKLRGTSEVPRLVVYRSLDHIYAQLIDDVNSKTILTVSTKSKDILEKLSGVKGKVEKSKLIGKLTAEKAVSNSISSVVFDRNGYLYHGRVKALAEGAREGGLKF